MTRRRSTSDDERALFEAAFKDTVPLATPGPSTRKPAKTKAALPHAKRAIPHSAPPPSGLDGRTAERLRRGVLAPQGRLDLHGLTEDSAHRALLTFIAGAAARGLRLVIVVTGKGAKATAPDEPFDLARLGRGVLRTMTPRWLAQPELARFVADVRSAHRSHGGAGALYVYLRKAR
jgi:DNA-nicking Smr family endonuclease